MQGRAPRLCSNVDQKNAVAGAVGQGEPQQANIRIGSGERSTFIQCADDEPSHQGVLGESASTLLSADGARRPFT
jgi:hypothetical protein